MLAIFWKHLKTHFFPVQFPPRLKLNAEKTELLWVGSKYGSASLVGSGLPRRLGDETITARNHVHHLGVTISSDLSTDKHISNASSSCF